MKRVLVIPISALLLLSLTFLPGCDSGAGPDEQVEGVAD